MTRIEAEEKFSAASPSASNASSGPSAVAPDFALAVANSGKPRRPSGARTQHANDPFSNAAHLHAFIEGWLPETDASISSARLAELRAWRDALAQALGRGADEEVAPATLAVLNRMATRAARVRRLTLRLGVVESVECRSIAERIAAACVDQLAACDASRIKRCARPECGLFFYDTTRNRSGRWHAEDPCGWRSRDERRRAAHDD